MTDQTVACYILQSGNDESQALESWSAEERNTYQRCVAIGLQEIRRLGRLIHQLDPLSRFIYAFSPSGRTPYNGVKYAYQHRREERLKN